MKTDKLVETQAVCATVLGDLYAVLRHHPEVKDEPYFQLAMEHLRAVIPASMRPEYRHVETRERIASSWDKAGQ